MDSTTMLIAATYVLAAAGVGGIILASMRLSGVPRPPLLFAMGHGLLASAGLTLVVYATVVAGAPQLVQVAAVLLMGAALGGAALNLLYHAKGLALPIPLVLGHGLVAAIALVLLWLGAGRPFPF